MNNYVLVDGKKYMTKHKAWMPIIRKPNTPRFLWNGSTDVTYGPGGQREWRGIVIVPVTPLDSSWGDIDDLSVALQTQGSIAFEDHFGNEYDVHSIIDFNQDSLSPMWDAPSNEFYVEVRLLEEVIA